MRLTLFRHGIAQDRADPACPPDEDRPLTDEGIDKTRRAARGLVWLWGDAPPAKMVQSPWLRAVQTADLLDDELGGRCPRTTFVEMRPFDPAAAVLDHLRDHDGDVVLVGHAPHLDELAAFLCGARPRAFRLKKAGAALFDFVDVPLAGQGTLVGVYAPKALRRLGP